MLRKLNVYIKGIGGTLVKTKGTFFYGIEVRRSVWRLLFWNFSSSGISPGIFSECLKTCLLLRCRWEMMRIPVRGIKEKRGIIYKASIERRVLQYGWQRSGKRVHSFWIVTRGHTDTYIPTYIRISNFIIWNHA